MVNFLKKVGIQKTGEKNQPSPGFPIIEKAIDKNEDTLEQEFVKLKSVNNRKGNFSTRSGVLPLTQA